MRRSTFLARSFRALGWLAAVSPLWAAPLELCPDNPHYFLFENRPAVLIGSGEHYGAVLNRDFDFLLYLTELRRNRLNHTRTFSGAYCEPPRAFNISSNTLAPAPGRLVCPWARSSKPGYANGGNKFDLERWDENYFRRLKNFVREAGRREIVVELNLFCPFYSEAQWRLSPMNAANNVNGVGQVARTNVYTLDKNGPLLAVQEKMVRKIVSELNGFDNLYYEICNEPYFGGVTIDWQRHIAEVIAATERRLPKRHLVSQNISNGSAKITAPIPDVSIFNFHYASPPDAVTVNYHFNKPIGDNETGFRGTNNLAYRREAWEFILAGGALFSHLDYSFAAGHETGDYLYPARQPGGGNADLRRQFGILRKFISQFDLTRMAPDTHVLAEPLPDSVEARVVSDPGRAYAVYLGPKTISKTGQAELPLHTIDLKLALPAGRWRIRWIDPVTGQAQTAHFDHGSGLKALTTPVIQEDLALAICRVD